MTRRPVVLIVDDQELNRTLFESFLQEDGYITRSAASGVDALQAVDAELPDLILLDLVMPGIGGMEVIQKLKSQEQSRTIPIVVVTGYSNSESRIQAFQAGAEDFLSKPVERSELRARVRNLLRMKEYHDIVIQNNRSLESEVRERTNQLLSQYRETVYLMTSAAEYRDEDTGAHVRRISALSAELARRYGLDERYVDTIFYASPMHDIGKIGIPDRILLKPSPLDLGEWEIMKNHTLVGWNILKKGTTPYVKMGAEISLTHHERWDGSGYPRGLTGEQIPLCGRILMMCDQYDALRSSRPYKPAYTHQHAMRILMEGDDRTRPEHFSPDLLKVFVTNANVFEALYRSEPADEIGAGAPSLGE
ncbi:MAG TPA: HD domain-containing phosphohydrolase [Spirochaetia bacterium]|nr:HD domain-containing phosphohydrolase [Spirochaetia bacterium]